jgi:glucose-6-phosphate isomerase
MKFNYKDTALFSKEEIEKTKKNLKLYLNHLNKVVQDGGYEEPEASLNLSSDIDLLKTVENLVQKKRTENLKYIFVVGIGGSNLGTKAVYEVIFGNLSLAKKEYPKMIFLDTNNPKILFDIMDVIKNDVKEKNELLINVISKSGTTTETIANFEVLYAFCKEKFGCLEDRVVVTTDKNSRLWDAALKREYSVLEIPKNIGGRYSVLSAVGLFPLALCGINVSELTVGAKNMRDICLEFSEENPALSSAVLIFLHYKNGKNINNNFFFHSELESIGKWYRQLMGESIGKEKDKDGKVANIGITPTTAIGSTDLHSMAQLYLGGPKDKFTAFVSIDFENSDSGIRVPEELEGENLVSGISGKDFNHIMNAIQLGVKTAYQKNDRPYSEVIIKDLKEDSLGRFLQFKMLEMMFLAELLNVNAFDQPNVEDYKKETRKLL